MGFEMNEYKIHSEDEEYDIDDDTQGNFKSQEIRISLFKQVEKIWRGNLILGYSFDKNEVYKKNISTLRPNRELEDYESEIVEALLPPVLRGEYGVTHKLNLGFTGKPSAPAEGGNLTIMMLEIDAGYWKLNKEDRRIIFLRFAENLDFGEIANYLELGTDSAARMRLKRSISRLINKIGGYKPYRDVDTVASEEDYYPPVE
jgi:hypothetical protein